MIHRFIVTLACFMLAGCFATEAGFKKTLDPWIGQHSDNLIAQVGVPQNTAILSDGGKVLEYRYSDTIVSGGGTYTVPATTSTSGMVGSTMYSGSTSYQQTRVAPVTSTTLVCNVRFRVAPNGIIQGYTFHGNACRV